ncbi:CehA/McbA family metallohydrolase [Dactylosporangium sp. AC04546]|uniref:CehA/McbA family metallohydrolase n=1 Tax=Dactylosporangium sp. AC04546 TaxID=2862460 RepID=UPI001EDDD40D|nr:CehA/McbA family metallohydrolase [Dactylosporangium sp. AC04546]WVK84924.1 CehA/McbA family metallohydrolase [Dactylosporangium sp. AC04546]
MSDHSHDHSHPHPHSHQQAEADGIGRRGLLAGAAGAGGLLLLAAAPGRAAAAPARLADNATVATAGAATLTGASRASAITQGTTLVHADMHNHTVMSDGDGDPNLAFASMRSAGLDVAALTDHATLFSISGLSKSEWDRTGTLANAADDPGDYTAIRGFEWSHPLLGHVNVWGTAGFTDLGGSSNMGGLYNWIVNSGGVASFNHPGREIARFGNFSYTAAARDAMVSLEMFNRGDDYLFDGWSDGRTSALNACLNAGWRTGLSGVSDEHGTNWGFPEGKGRMGLWVTQNTRAGVFEAMRARRFFATRVSGLRLDATATTPAGVVARMGGVLPLSRGDVRFAVDLNRGPEWDGKPLRIQVLRPGSTAPTVPLVVDTVANTVATFTLPLDVAAGNWVVLRISDPTQANPSPGPNAHPCNDFGVAYSSPWWLQP